MVKRWWKRWKNLWKLEERVAALERQSEEKQAKEPGKTLAIPADIIAEWLNGEV